MFSDQLVVTFVGTHRSPAPPLVDLGHSPPKAFGDRLRFEGKALNATMLSAIVALTKIMPQEEAAAKYLALIFQWYGGTINVYSRLYRIVSTVNGYYKDQSADTETVCQAGADQNFIAQRL